MTLRVQPVLPVSCCRWEPSRPYAAVGPTWTLSTTQRILTFLLSSEWFCRRHSQEVRRDNAKTVRIIKILIWLIWHVWRCPYVVCWVIEVDATCSDFDFGTALHIAASNLCTSAVKCLLELGANPAFRVCDFLYGAVTCLHALQFETDLCHALFLLTLPPLYYTIYSLLQSNKIFKGLALLPKWKFCLTLIYLERDHVQFLT